MLVITIIILLLVSVLLIGALKIASLSTSHIQVSYKRERAKLFLRSVIENAIMAIEGYKRDGKCLEKMHFKNKEFEADVFVLRYYFYKNSKDATLDCNKKLIDTPISNGYVLLKVVVYSKKVRLSKITLQRP